MAQCGARQQTGKHFGCHERSNQPVKTTRRVQQWWQHTQRLSSLWSQGSAFSKSRGNTLNKQAQTHTHTHTHTHTARKTPDHRNQLFFVPVCSSGKLEIKCGAWSKILIRAVSGARVWHCDSDCKQIMKTQSSIWETNFSLTVRPVICGIISLQHGGLECIWHTATNQILFSVWPWRLTRTPMLASNHHHQKRNAIISATPLPPPAPQH